MGMEEEILQITYQVKGAEEGRALEAQMGRTSAATGAFVDTADRASRSGANMGRTMLEAGRFVQDGFQGGIGGVLNNIEGLTMALGLGSGLAGVLTILGVTASIVGPKVIDFGKSLVGGSNAIPESADAVGRWTDNLKKVNKELDGLKEKQGQTNAELVRFIALEKEKREAEDRAAQAKGVVEVEQTKGADQKGRAKRVQELVDDLGGPQVLQDVQKAFTEKYGSFGAATDRDNAEKLLLNARQGKSAATDELESLFAAGYGGKDNRTGAAVRGTDKPGLLPGEAHQIDPDVIAKGRAAREKMEKEQAEKSEKALKEVRDFLDDEFDRDIKEIKEGGKAGKAGVKDEQADLAREAKINEKAIDDEAAKIGRTVGGPRQAEYEARLAGDAAIRAKGGPVATTARQDRAYRRAGGVAGVDYALPPGVLERRLREQMAREFTGRGAGEQAANLAAKGIGDKGNEDLARRMAQLNGAQGTNQGRLITLAAALAGEMEHAVGVQVRHTAMIGEIGRKVQALQGTGRIRGR